MQLPLGIKLTQKFWLNKWSILISKPTSKSLAAIPPYCNASLHLERCQQTFYVCSMCRCRTIPQVSHFSVGPCQESAAYCHSWARGIESLQSCLAIWKQVQCVYRMRSSPAGDSWHHDLPVPPTWYLTRESILWGWSVCILWFLISTWQDPEQDMDHQQLAPRYSWDWNIYNLSQEGELKHSHASLPIHLSWDREWRFCRVLYGIIRETSVEVSLSQASVLRARLASWHSMPEPRYWTRCGITLRSSRCRSWLPGSYYFFWSQVMIPICSGGSGVKLVAWEHGPWKGNSIQGCWWRLHSG